MLSHSLSRLNRTDRPITVDDISDNLLAGRSAAHTACHKYLQMGSYDTALQYAEEIIHKEPDTPDGYVFKARALFKKKRYLDSEQVLLKVMRIAQDSDLIRSDVEGMIKLKDELANSRVEILSARNFREPIDIAEMHWNDTNKPILELIGFQPQPRAAANTGAGDSRRVDESLPMDVDPEIVEIIGPERAKQLYPHLFGGAAKSKANGSTYSQRRSGNLNLSAEFPVKETRNLSSGDGELRSAGIQQKLQLAEEKNTKYEKKINQLEGELRRVYEHFKKINEEKSSLEKKCDKLLTELDRVIPGFNASKYQTDDEVQVLKTVPKSKSISAYDYIRKQKRRALVFTNSKYAATARARLRPSANFIKGKSLQTVSDQYNVARPVNRVVRTRAADQIKIRSGPYKSVSFKGNPDERLIRDLTYNAPRAPIRSTSMVQPSILARNPMPGSGRRFPPGILPMPSYQDSGYGAGNVSYGAGASGGYGGGYQNYQGYGSGGRMNRTAFF